jgi:hypothetical protein
LQFRDNEPQGPGHLGKAYLRNSNNEIK